MHAIQQLLVAFPQSQLVSISLIHFLWEFFMLIPILSKLTGFYVMLFKNFLFKILWQDNY